MGTESKQVAAVDTDMDGQNAGAVVVAARSIAVVEYYAGAELDQEEEIDAQDSLEWVFAHSHIDPLSEEQPVLVHTEQCSAVDILEEQVAVVPDCIVELVPAQRRQTISGSAVVVAAALETGKGQESEAENAVGELAVDTVVEGLVADRTRS